MEKKIESANNVARSYDDFEPYCSWQRDDRSDTLVIHVSEFKKNQLKVHINSLGILTVKGERPINETKWTRFSKQIKLSKDCHTNDIHAKFVGGLLYITVPKKITPHASSGHPATTTTPVGNNNPHPPKEADQKVLNSEMAQDKAASEKPKSPADDDSEMIESRTNSDTYKIEKYEFWRKSLGKRTRMEKKVAFSLALATMLAVGAYFTYKLYRSPQGNN